MGQAGFGMRVTTEDKLPCIRWESRSAHGRKTSFQKWVLVLVNFSLSLPTVYHVDPLHFAAHWSAITAVAELLLLLWCMLLFTAFLWLEAADDNNMQLVVWVLRWLLTVSALSSKIMADTVNDNGWEEALSVLCPR